MNESELKKEISNAKSDMIFNEIIKNLRKTFKAFWTDEEIKELGLSPNNQNSES